MYHKSRIFYVRSKDSMYVVWLWFFSTTTKKKKKEYVCIHCTKKNKENERNKMILQY